MRVPRSLAPVLLRCARRYPVVTVTGPRQSGKTTLCRAVFPRKPYVTFERLDERERALADPRGFLAEHRGGAVLDEVQHVPALLSYLQADVDDDPRPGRFVLTGSQHLGLSRAVGQSLAGRTAMLHLPPLALDELRRFPSAPRTLSATLLAGGYPRIHAEGISPGRWLADYVATYVQRDVRSVLEVRDLAAFSTFVGLCAGRTAQEVNLSTLGADAGVSHVTAGAWLAALEGSFLVVRVPSWHANARKRLVKAPKLHWLDSGLVCHLLGIQNEAQLRLHPLRGAVFESWVVAEVWKAHAARGVEPRLSHLRQTRGVEVDLLVERGRELRGIECKSGATVPSDAFDGLARLPDVVGGAADVRPGALVYGGEGAQRRSTVDVVPWHELPSLLWLRK